MYEPAVPSFLSKRMGNPLLSRKPLRLSLRCTIACLESILATTVAAQLKFKHDFMYHVGKSLLLELLHLCQTIFSAVKVCFEDYSHQQKEDHDASATVQTSRP